MVRPIHVWLQVLWYKLYRSKISTSQLYNKSKSGQHMLSRVKTLLNCISYHRLHKNMIYSIECVAYIFMNCYFSETEQEDRFIKDHLISEFASEVKWRVGAKRRDGRYIWYDGRRDHESKVLPLIFSVNSVKMNQLKGQ